MEIIDNISLKNYFEINTRIISNNIMNQDFLFERMYDIKRNKNGSFLDFKDVDFGQYGEVDISTIKPVKKGDFIVNRNIPSVTSLYDLTSPMLMISKDGFVNKNITSITPLNNVCSDYFNIVFQTNNFILGIEGSDFNMYEKIHLKYSHSFNKNKISLKDIENILVPNISFSQQQKIVASLKDAIDKASEMIEKTREQLKKCINLKRGIIHSASGYNSNDTLFRKVIMRRDVRSKDQCKI